MYVLAAILGEVCMQMCNCVVLLCFNLQSEPVTAPMFVPTGENTIQYPYLSTYIHPYMSFALWPYCSYPRIYLGRVSERGLSHSREISALGYLPVPSNIVSHPAVAGQIKTRSSS